MPFLFHFHFVSVSILALSLEIARSLATFTQRWTGGTSWTITTPHYSSTQLSLQTQTDSLSSTSTSERSTSRTLQSYSIRKLGARMRCSRASSRADSNSVQRRSCSSHRTPCPLSLKSPTNTATLCPSGTGARFEGSSSTRSACT